ncbi:hypothetical protein STTU_3631 [Streptomyces sp. Tu6071]|nr:hypothetical protein STTU_3631 [Streptomyces sp. Tu6071]
MRAPPRKAIFRGGGKSRTGVPAQYDLRSRHSRPSRLAGIVKGELFSLITGQSREEFGSR